MKIFIFLNGCFKGSQKYLYLPEGTWEMRHIFADNYTLIKFKTERESFLPYLQSLIRQSKFDLFVPIMNYYAKHANDFLFPDFMNAKMAIKQVIEERDRLKYKDPRSNLFLTKPVD